MKPVIVTLSYGELTKLIEKNKQRYLDRADVNTIDALFSDAIKIAQDLEKKRMVDVFICSGNSSLSEYINTPFVEIKTTGYDILLALKTAKQHSNRVAVITHSNNKIHYLNEISDMLTLDIEQINYDRPGEVEGIIDRLVCDKTCNVIGPGLVVEIARMKKINATLIYSEDGVSRALATALRIALSTKAESAKGERFRIIMDFAHEGIIATDQEGRISVFNPAAEKITKISCEKALGTPINTLLPGIVRDDTGSKLKQKINQFQTIGNSKVVTNVIPININQEMLGSVITFQDIGTIQLAEEKIRWKLSEKGFVAKSKLDNILGQSEQIIEAKKKALLYAKSESTVLITGESGTGKELFAQGLHNASSRAKRSFVAINCQALPENLLESELFGYEEGAFSGAKKGGKSGIFELAHGGTIFLDEIGEIPASLQSKLLRVLEEREVMRIGSNRIIPVDIRVVASTNINLWEMVGRKKFREDLYYRLNVLELDIPPLRMRKMDIPLLVKAFLNDFRKDLDVQKAQKIAGHPIFLEYEWPGNIRELKNVVERLAVLYTEDSDISTLLRSIFKPQANYNFRINEYEEMRRILNEARGNKTKAAQLLGISRTTLWRKLRDMQIE